MLTVQLPDGTTMQFPEGTSEETMKRMARQYSQQNALDQKPEPTWVNDVLGGTRSFLQGMTIGTADEIGLGLAAGIASLEQGKSFSEVYNDMRTTYDQQQEAYEEANPVLSTALEIAGGVASPASWAIAGKVASTGASATRTGLLGGAIEGGIYGAASAEGGLEERAVGGLQGAAIGGAFGGLFGKGVEKFGKWSDEKVIRQAQDDIYGNAVAQFATNPRARLRAITNADGTRKYSEDDIARVAQAMSRTGQELDIPRHTMQQQMQSELVRNGQVVRRQKNKLGEAADKYLGILSTRVGNISQEVKGRLRKYEADISIDTGHYMRETLAFREGFGKLDDATKTRVSQLLMNDEYDAAARLLQAKNPALAEELTNVRGVLDKLGSDLQHSGHTFALRDNYFPRVMRNYEDWRVRLGMEDRSRLDAAIQKYAKQKGMDVSQVSQAAKVDIANQMFRGKDLDVVSGGMTNTRQRLRDNVDYNEFGDYYMMADEALESYITRSVNNIHRRSFFGDNAAALEEGVDESIGKLVTQLGLDPKNADELQDLLRARFINGEQQMSSAAQQYKAAHNMFTIGNALSTITQLGDIANPIFAYGMRNTVKGMYQAIRGKGMTVGDLGLDNMIAQDMTTNAKRGLQGWSDGLLNLTQFRRLDRFGKQTFLNAGISKLKKQANSEARGALVNKYSTMFDDADSVIDDLANGRMTDDVKAMMFSELSDFQPISKSEMPEAYLNMKNGRLIYSLQSFTLKQIDVMRREVVQQIRKAETKGQQLAAAKKGLQLFSLLATMNLGTQMSKDLILGREVKPEDIPLNLLYAGIGVYGANKYSGGLLEREGLGGLVKNYVPTAPLDALMPIAKEVQKEYNDGDGSVANALRKLPVGGQMLYYWLGDGLDNWEMYNEAE